MTPTLSILIDQCAVKAVIVQAVGEHLLCQDTIVNRDQLVPVVLQHDTLQKTLAGLLEKVGLERKPVPVEDLHAYIARREAGKAPAS